MNTSTKRISKIVQLLKQSPFGLVLGLAGILLSGCEKASSPAISCAAVAEGEKKVVVLTCDEYFDPDVLAKFTAQTGVEVDIQVYLSTEEMEEKLKSNPQNFDVIVAEQGSVAKLRLARLLVALDPKQLPNKGNLDPRYLNMAFDPENKFSIPYMWGITALAYRKDHFTTPPQVSIDLLFEPTLAGKISLLKDRNECYAMALRRFGNAKDEVTPDQVLQATDSLLQLIRSQRARFGSDNEVKEHLLNGESSVAMIYNGDAQIIAQEHPEIACFIPRRGAVMWVDSFAIPRDSTHVAYAHQFINFLIDGQIAAQGSNFLRYASPNKAAEPYIDPNLLNDPIVYPGEEVRARLYAMPLWNKESLRVMNNGWRLIQEASELNLVQAPSEPQPPKAPPTPPETIGQSPTDSGGP